MVPQRTINFKSSNICCNPQSFRVCHGGKISVCRPKNSASSCVHSLPSLILKHLRESIGYSKNLEVLTERDVKPVSHFRLTEETEVQPSETGAAECITSHRCYFSFSFLLPFLFLLFFFLPFLSFWPLTTNICLIHYRILYPVTPLGLAQVIESPTIKKETKPFSKQCCGFLPKFRGIPDILQLVKSSFLIFINFM